MVLAKPWHHTAIIYANETSFNTIKNCKKVEITVCTLKLQVTTTI